ncbi:MAG: ABC transporter permease [Dehalococcoidia bacterium]|nr:ABC transporter permease [Dehalococcoidia bacterium]
MLPPIIQGVLNTSISEGLVYAFVTIGVFLTFRVLAFPDLTVDGSFVVGGSIVALMIHVGGYNPFLATIAAFMGGLAAGSITGLLNTKLRLPALLAGILMMVGLYSVNLLIMGRPNTPMLRDITIFDSVASWFGMERSTLLVIIVFAVIAFIVFMVLNWFLRTEIGLTLRATGDNEQMVRSLGVDTDKNILLGCSISNGLVALSGALVAQNQQFCDVNMGVGMIVMGLAAVIIGEALVHPRGVASMLLAAFAGTFLYRLFITIALRLGLAPGNLKLITALLVIIALAIPYIQKKLRHEWMPPAVRW